MNPLPQLTDGGILNPERITVDAFLASGEVANVSNSVVPATANHLAQIFELLANTQMLQSRSVNEPLRFHPVTIQLPAELERNMNLMLSTNNLRIQFLSAASR
jgi:hypothetical protein